MITNDVDEAALMADRIVPLTPGPSAYLERDFPCEPRPATIVLPSTLTLNSSACAMSSRVGIDLNREAKALRVAENIVLPDVQPVDFSQAG